MKLFSGFSSIQETPQAVIQDCITQLHNSPSEANFGFLYATDSMAEVYAELLEQCKQASGINHWVGTLGMGIIASHKEIYEQPAASMLLCQFDENEFSIFKSLEKTEDIETGVQTPHPFAMHTGLIHGDPFNQSTQAIIEGLQNHLENGFLAGGLTSSRDKHYQIANQVVSGGVSGVLFSENIGIQSNLSQGCSPVGNKHKITQAKENMVFTLDDKPALDLLMQEMHIADIQELEKRAHECFIGLCVPGSDKADYTIRNLMGANDEYRVIALNDYPQEDNELVFCQRTRDTAVEDMQKMLKSLASRLDGPPKGGV